MNLDKFEVVFINEDQTCATFKFYNEDHTLANVLRFAFYLFLLLKCILIYNFLKESSIGKQKC